MTPFLFVLDVGDSHQPFHPSMHRRKFKINQRQEQNKVSDVLDCPTINIFTIVFVLRQHGG